MLTHRRACMPLIWGHPHGTAVAKLPLIQNNLTFIYIQDTVNFWTIFFKPNLINISVNQVGKCAARDGEIKIIDSPNIRTIGVIF